MAMWPTCGQSGYSTRAVLGVANAWHEDKNHKWLCGPHVSKVAISPVPTLRSPTLSAGTKNGDGYVAHMWVKWLHGYTTNAVFGVTNA